MGKAEISINTTTGKVKVDKIVACHYIGKAINPESVRGQVLGSISMSWGYALPEDSRDLDGQCLADNFGTYKLQRSSDIPEYKVILLEEPEPIGPYGVIGICKPPSVATAPAITNVDYNAIGVRITSLPITPKKILEALN